MFERIDNNTTIGTIAYNHERKQLELNGYLLDCGDRIELLVFKHWIPGTVQLSASGWYLLTLDKKVGIRLQTGLTAHCNKEIFLVTPASETSQDAS